ncbi:MAG: DUF3306 domain-containing protein [Rhodospirillales bacterium]
MSGSAEESGLSRWSRLKRAKAKTARGSAAPQAAAAAVAEPVAVPADGLFLPEPEIVGPYRPWKPPLDVRRDQETETPETAEPREEDYGLPAIDGLTADSDFAPFLNDGIPEVLKRRALRKLWSCNPVFGFRDGLNDYDDDFSMIGKVAEVISTNYKVGRGLLGDVDEAEGTTDDAETLDKRQVDSSSIEGHPDDEANEVDDDGDTALG